MELDVRQKTPDATPDARMNKGKHTKSSYGIYMPTNNTYRHGALRVSLNVRLFGPQLGN